MSILIFILEFVFKVLTWEFRVKEATKGYFTDLNATRKHGGKTWIAPRVLIREDVSQICYLS